MLSAVPRSLLCKPSAEGRCRSTDDGHSENLRVLIIGAGKMGIAHSAAFKSVPGFEIVGITSRGGDTAAKVAAEYGIPRHGTDWRALAAETDAEACVVAVSHMLSEEITEAVLDAGFHILTEKPVSLQSKAIHRLAALAQERGVIAMVGMNRRFYPSVMAAVDMIRIYGPMVGVTVIAPDPVRRFNAQHKYDEQVYANWTRMNTLHAIDLLRLAGGEVASMHVDLRVDDGSQERSIVASMRFCCGGIGSYISHSSCGATWELRLHGDGVETRIAPLESVGTIQIEGAHPRPLRVGTEPVGVKRGLHLQARAFLELVRDLGRIVPPASDLTDHARTMELVEMLEGNEIEDRDTAVALSPAALMITPRP